MAGERVADRVAAPSREGAAGSKSLKLPLINVSR